MTVSTTTSTVTYQGNGATTVFTFPFIGVMASDLIITYTDANGVASILNPVQYSVVINPVPVGGLWGIGGSVTYPLSGTPIQPGTLISITRDVPYTQDVSIANQGAFYPQAVEQGLDVLELQIQQIETGLDHTLRTPVTDLLPLNELPPAKARANGYLSFDDNGQPIIVSEVSPPEPTIYANPRRVSTTGTSTINMIPGDSWAGISIYQSGTPQTTVQLPAFGGPYNVFDASGNAGSFPITVLPPAGQTINGLSQYILAFGYQSATFYLDGVSVLVV